MNLTKEECRVIAFALSDYIKEFGTRDLKKEEIHLCMSILEKLSDKVFDKYKKNKPKIELSEFDTIIKIGTKNNWIRQKTIFEEI